MVPSHPRNAAALIIGNELLSGKVHEQNLVVLARVLRTLGISLQRVVLVGDDVPTIAKEVQTLSASHDLLFTSGGVGPTHDDLTIEAVAVAFATTVEINEDIEAMLRSHFGDSVTAGHLLMARVPKGCELVASGTIRWPTVKMRNVWILPGVPHVFRMKLAVAAEHITPGLPFFTRTLHTQLDEPVLVPLLDKILPLFPQVQIGSYPKWKDPDCKTELTFDGLDQAAVQAACDALVTLLPQGASWRIS